MNLSDYLKDKKNIVDKALADSISDNDIPSKLYESMKYSLLAGGKRIRPILSIAAAETIGENYNAAIPFGIAVEMIHTFSLIHDDLPSMDNDDLRRGKPTNHKVYGDAVAILAGDGLLAEAFYYLLSNAKTNEEKHYLEATKLLACATGARGMTGGQVLDIEAEGKCVDISELERLHTLKTGALISVSVVGGALIAGADEVQLKALNEYGNKLGLAFQIADDILDIEGDESEIGKPVGSDVNNQKSTYPKLLGLGGARELAKQTVKDAIEKLEMFSESAWPLRELANYVISRKK